MAVSATMYRQALLRALLKGIDWANDDIRVMLCTNAYTPNYDTNVYKDVVNPTEASGTGYVANGAALGTKTNTYTPAASATAWVANTGYSVGDIVRKVTQSGGGAGHIFRCVAAGTSHATTEPTWASTMGATYTDGTVTWQECGAGFITLSAANVTWASSTITAYYAAVYDNTPVSNKPMICCVDFGGAQSSNNGNFNINWSADGILQVPVY